MPQPQPNRKQSQFGITQRHQYYVVKEEHLTQEMRTWSSDRVLRLRNPKGEKKGKAIDGMRKIYQLKTTKTTLGRNIQYRNVTCACNCCVQSNYELCRTNSTWASLDLEQTNRRQYQRRNNQQRQTIIESDSGDAGNSSDDEVTHTVREHINDAIARTQMNINETFLTQSQRQAEISKGRSQRLEGREANKPKN